MIITHGFFDGYRNFNTEKITRQVNGAKVEKYIIALRYLFITTVLCKLHYPFFYTARSPETVKVQNHSSKNTKLRRLALNQSYWSFIKVEYEILLVNRHKIPLNCTYIPRWAQPLFSVVFFENTIGLSPISNAMLGRHCLFINVEILLFVISW